MVGRLVPSTWSTARSLLGAVPRTFAVSFLPSEKCAWILVGALDHMVVGDDDAVARHDEAGTGGAAVAGTAVVDDGDDRGNVGLQDGGDVAARL